MKPLFATLCLLAACARVVEVPDADGGVPAQPHLADVEPMPGPVDAGARFRLAFSVPMDASLLLVDATHSETVVLVAPANVEVIAAAIAHGRLSAQLRALLVPARLTLDAQAQTVELVPERTLDPGEIWLLVASRLKDAQGRKLEGNGARFDYSVAPPVVYPRLVQPAPGATAPRNLARVHLDVPDGAQGKPVALRGPAGALAQAFAAAPGPLNLSLCAEGSACAALMPGQSYTVQLDGADVPGAGFTAGACSQLAAPALLSVAPRLRDEALAVDVAVDAPAELRVDVAPVPAAGSGDDDDATLALLCARGGCSSARALTSCVRDACAAASDGGTAAGPDGGAAAPAPCEAHLELSGLSPGTEYLIRVAATDDENNVALSPASRVTTLGALPQVSISEVMAWAPLPAPRATGQYVELLNGGRAPCDLTALGLLGPDGKARPLTDAAGPLLLGPGERALAVGASFDAARYPDLSPGVPILRATTQRLLGRGLTEASPPAFSLVWLGADGGPVELDSFPGGTSCGEGESVERDAQGPGFSCGVSGGTPGRGP